MKVNYVMDAVNKRGEVTECRTDAKSKNDAAWIFGHSPSMMGLYPRWFTLRRKGDKKKPKPRNYIDALCKPERRKGK